MLVAVEVVGFEQVVVDVLDGAVDPNALDAHGLEFQHHQGTQHVLQKCLVDAQRDLVAGLHVSTHQV